MYNASVTLTNLRSAKLVIDAILQETTTASITFLALLGHPPIHSSKIIAEKIQNFQSKIEPKELMDCLF